MTRSSMVCRRRQRGMPAPHRRYHLPAGTITALHMGEVGVQQWQSNLYTRTFVDDNKNGIWTPTRSNSSRLYENPLPGWAQRQLSGNGLQRRCQLQRDVPLFNWYVVEADSTAIRRQASTPFMTRRPCRCTPFCGPGMADRACGTSTAYDYLVNTFESVPCPPICPCQARSIAKTADCSAEAASFAAARRSPARRPLPPAASIHRYLVEPRLGRC